MESPEFVDQLPGKASQFIDLINAIKRTHKEWYNSAEGETDARFGDSLEKSLAQAKKIVNFNPSKHSLNDIKKYIEEYTKSLNIVQNDGKTLQEFYERRRRPRDVDILRKFLK